MVKLSGRTNFVVAQRDVAGAYLGVVLEGVAPVLVCFEAGCQMRGGDSEHMLLEVWRQVLLAESNLAEWVDPLPNEVVKLLLADKAHDLVPSVFLKNLQQPSSDLGTSLDLAGLVVHLAPGVLALVDLQQEGFL